VTDDRRTRAEEEALLQFNFALLLSLSPGETLAAALRFSQHCRHGDTITGPAWLNDRKFPRSI
jgi:hypothetical protein